MGLVVAIQYLLWKIKERHINLGQFFYLYVFPQLVVPLKIILPLKENFKSRKLSDLNATLISIIMLTRQQNGERI